MTNRQRTEFDEGMVFGRKLQKLLDDLREQVDDWEPDAARVAYVLRETLVGLDALGCHDMVRIALNAYGRWEDERRREQAASTRWDELLERTRELVQQIVCPYCSAPAGAPCLTSGGKSLVPAGTHSARGQAAREMAQAELAELDNW